MDLEGFNPWKIVEYNNDFPCPFNHQYAQSEMMSHPMKFFHMSSLDRPKIFQ
jgi:hypothetical protein